MSKASKKRLKSTKKTDTKTKLRQKITRPKKVGIPENKTIKQLIIKASFLVFVLSLIVAFLDFKGYFKPDATNNHTKKKWTSFYNLTDDINIDVLMIGNSHLYTGINPKTLSAAMGVNSFILASPGTHVGDFYYTLKEALKATKPKVVVIETFGISDLNPYELKNGSLSDQFKSFAARKNIPTKLASTPFLFDSDNYFYAWSNTIRNHNYLFTNQKQIHKNFAKQKEVNKKENKLYLGRYVRFTTGLQDSILNLYKTKGASLDGNEKTFDQPYAEHYVKKITELCKANEIEIVFLTLPMYQAHVKDYPVWKKNLEEILSKYSHKWLDLQEKKGYKGFDKTSFENTYSANQHMTYNGSLIATYKLADYIRNQWPNVLPNRSSEKAWTEMFYGEEGYFENYPLKESGNENKILSSKVNINGSEIVQIDFLSREKVNTILAKVKNDRQAAALENYKLRLTIQFQERGENKTSLIDLPYMAYNTYNKPLNDVIFSQNIKKDIKVLAVVNASFLPK